MVNSILILLIFQLSDLAASLLSFGFATQHPMGSNYYEKFTFEKLLRMIDTATGSSMYEQSTNRPIPSCHVSSFIIFIVIGLTEMSKKLLSGKTLPVSSPKMNFFSIFSFERRLVKQLFTTSLQII